MTAVKRLSELDEGRPPFLARWVCSGHPQDGQVFVVQKNRLGHYELNINHDVVKTLQASPEKGVGWVKAGEPLASITLFSTLTGKPLYCLTTGKRQLDRTG